MPGARLRAGRPAPALSRFHQSDNGRESAQGLTLAGAGISDARLMFAYQRDNAPLARSITIDDVGGAAVYLLSGLSAAVTGEVHYVDAGYNIVSMPRLETLKVVEETKQAAE